ncbi:MAG: hypothetical protein F4X99_08430 [Gammaproteobacteria bacterium]|nr:hypothetical protein [Gammaproteobacteria bacterium]
MTCKRFTGCLVAAAVALAAAPAWLPGSPGPAFAAEEEEERKTRRVPTMTEATYKKLAEAQELIDLKPPDVDGAIEVLDDMMKRSRRYNGNEIGQIYNMYAFCYYLKEDVPRAIKAYEMVLAQGEDIPEGLEVSTLDNLSKFHFIEENFEESLKYMQLWLAKASNPGPDAYIFMGQVYYQLQDFANSIAQIERGIAVARERGLIIRENWWGLLRYLYFEQENWDKVLEILEVLVRDFPKRDYWLQLAGIYGQEGYEKKQVYAYEAAHVAGFINRDRDIVNYAGLMAQDQVPYRAAKALQKAIDDEVVEGTERNLQSLGQYWQLAQETDLAIPTYEKAGERAEEGEILSRLASLYLEKDRFEECVDAASRALDKGGLTKSYNTQVVQGQCEFNRDRLTSARRIFVSARSNARRDRDRSVESICQRWIRYIDNESRRRRELAAAQ